MHWRRLGYKRYPYYLSAQRHDTSPHAFVPILSLVCIFSSAICHPSHSPTVPTPILTYAGDATPSHAHRVISSDVRYSIAFSFISFSYRSRITIVLPVPPRRHICAQNYRSRLSIMYPVLPRHSCIHHTYHNCSL